MSKRRSSLRRLLSGPNVALLLTCLLCFSAGAALPLFQPSTIEWIAGRDPTMSLWVSAVVNNDPKIGTEFALGSIRDLNGVPHQVPSPGRPTCVYFIWDCRACSLEAKLRDLDLISRAHPQLQVWVVVVGGRAPLVRQFWAEHGLNLPVLIDSNAVAARGANAVVAGRTYLFDNAGRLQFISWPEDDYGTVRKQVIEFLKVAR